MIPAELITAFNRGEASYKTLVLGGGGNYNIEVPENKYIIIFYFSFANFFNLKAGDNPTYVVNHAIQFQSGSGRYRYSHRSSLNPYDDDENVSNGVAKDFWVYQFHDQNVNLTISEIPPVKSWVVTTGPTLPDKNNNMEAVPNGYGVGAGSQPCTQIIDFLIPGVSEVNPVGRHVTPNSFPQELWPGVNFTNFLPPPDGTLAFVAQGEYSYPLVNIGYALFNKTSKFYHRQ